MKPAWSVLALFLVLGGFAFGPSAWAQTSQQGPTPQPVMFEPFIRGDANVDDSVDIGDAVRILEMLFAGAAPLECSDAGDANDDEVVNIADAIFLLGFLFAADPPPPAPFPACGPDPTNDLQLGCASYTACPTDLATATHILRRIAYNGTPDEIALLQAMGAEAYIMEQLDPLSIVEDPQIATKIAAIPIVEPNYWRYYEHVLLRGHYSNRQLQEQMTDFWSNHFNTYFWSVRSYFRNLPIYNENQARIVAMLLEDAEDAAFRAEAFGTFNDLVLINATSPTMLIYLDNVSNLAADPNENYARELLELHTVGVTGGYSQNDVEQLARCFTGWTVCKKAPADAGDPLAPCVPDTDPTGVWSFHFDAANHDYGQKVLFGGTGYPLTIPSRPNGSPDGVLDGYDVIAHLSVATPTAQYVSTKLVEKFVDDDAPFSVVSACLGTWLATGGDIGAVMETLLLSDEFLGTTYRWNKVKTPMEQLLSTTRILEAETNDAGPILSWIGSLQHVPLNWGTPDGYPEYGDDWIGTSKTVDTIEFNKYIYEFNGGLTYDPRTIQLAAGIDETDTAEVVDFWLELMFSGAHTPIDHGLAGAFWETDDGGNPATFTPGSVAYDDQLRKFLAFLRSWPQAFKQ